MKKMTHEKHERQNIHNDMYWRVKGKTPTTKTERLKFADCLIWEFSHRDELDDDESKNILGIVSCLRHKSEINEEEQKALDDEVECALKNLREGCWTQDSVMGTIARAYCKAYNLMTLKWKGIRRDGIRSLVSTMAKVRDMVFNVVVENIPCYKALLRRKDGDLAIFREIEGWTNNIHIKEWRDLYVWANSDEVGKELEKAMAKE